MTEGINDGTIRMERVHQSRDAGREKQMMQ